MLAKFLYIIVWGKMEQKSDIIILSCRHSLQPDFMFSRVSESEKTVDSKVVLLEIPL